MENHDTTSPRNALDTGIVAAHLAEPLIKHEDGRTHVILPEGFDLHEVTDPNVLRGPIKQQLTVDDRTSLTNYANRFSDKRSIIVADYDAGTISAHLDWHEDNQNGLERQHACHTATQKLRNSEEYDRWNKIEGEMHMQDAFAMFIEENVADVVDPDQSTLLEICRDLEATQGVSFKSGVRLESGDRTFQYSDETNVKGELVVPTEIKLSIPLYQGEEPREIRAKFRFRVSQQGLTLGIRWHRVEYLRQATFCEMATLISDDTGLPVFFGRK